MSLMVSTGAEPKAPSDVVKYESHQSFTRTSGLFKAGSGAAVSIALGLILGLSGALSIAGAADDGITGNGAISGVALGAKAQPGVYSVEAISAGTNTATFAVFDPSGNRLADAVTGTPYDNGQIAFAIADGVTDFVVGDSFSITVTETNAGKYVPLDLSAVDGAQTVAGIALADLTVPDGADAPGLVLVNGPAFVLRKHLTYPDGASAAQKAAIDAALLARQIKVVDAV